MSIPETQGVPGPMTLKSMETIVTCQECDFERSGFAYSIGDIARIHREETGHQVRVRLVG